MAAEKDRQNQCFFSGSPNVWFPDFMETVEAAQKRCERYPTPFVSMNALLDYLRKEISRNQLIEQFLAQEAPRKILQSDRRVYLQVKALCEEYRNQKMCAAEFDERLLLSFRARPVDDTFSPDFKQWEKMNELILRLREKEKKLPVHFDGIGWMAYLTGRLTRSAYVQQYLEWGVGEHLSQYLTYGVGAEEFAKKYALEIDVCMRLRTLCLEYRDGKEKAEEFDRQMLHLAQEFCEKIM